MARLRRWLSLLAAAALLLLLLSLGHGALPFIRRFGPWLYVFFMATATAQTLLIVFAWPRLRGVWPLCKLCPSEAEATKNVTRWRRLGRLSAWPAVFVANFTAGPASSAILAVALNMSVRNALVAVTLANICSRAFYVTLMLGGGSLFAAVLDP
jgi:hypothetical protein